MPLLSKSNSITQEDKPKSVFGKTSIGVYFEVFDKQTFFEVGVVSSHKSAKSHPRECP